MADHGRGHGSEGQERLPALDGLRGAAVCGMVVYHLVWDLADRGWPLAEPAGSRGWTLFGDIVAGTFLGLSGIGLTLARTKGPRFAMRRLLAVALAAALVSAASVWFDPERPILFGILHCILVTNIVSLPMLAIRPAARLALAAVCAALPWAAASIELDGPGWSWLGLSTALPRTLDFRPILPWLALVLVGTVLGERLVATRRPSGPSAASRRGRRGGSLVARSAVWAGRHSLAIYLVHQPVLYGLVIMVGLIARPAPPDPDPFMSQCGLDCAATGAEARLCRVACGCAALRLAADARLPTQSLSARRLAEITSACRSLPPSPR